MNLEKKLRLEMFQNKTLKKLPEILSSVEQATQAEPFARFLATQLHLVTIYEVNCLFELRK